MNTILIIILGMIACGFVVSWFVVMGFDPRKWKGGGKK